MKFEIQATTLLMLMTATGCSIIVDGSKYGHSSDSGVADTGVMDTGVTDTGVTDTGVTDTGVTDTGVTDTGVTDTGAPPACAEPCMSPKIIDAFGRCVMPRACPSPCMDGSMCNPRAGACEFPQSCSMCPSGSSCDGFGQCVPDCACGGTNVHYAGEVGCRAPIDCIPPQRPRMGDPTRCFTPCDACGTSEFCMNGECRTTECSAGPTPFECAGSAGATLPIPSPAGASAAGALPAMRIRTLPADALTTRVVVVPNPVDASAWGLMWADSHTVKWASVWAHTPTSGTTCYRGDPGSTLVQCPDTGLPLVGFGPADFNAAVVGDLLSEPGTPDIRLGASAGTNTGMWRISTASGNVCGTGQFVGVAPSDELTGRIAVARAHTNPSLYPVHLYGLSAFPGMPGYPAVWRDQMRSVLTSAIWDVAFTPPSSVPSGGLAAAGSIGAYRTQDNRLVIWDGNFSQTPSLAPGFDNLIGDPAAAVDSSTPAETTATVVAPRSIGTSRELMATTCSPGAGTAAPSCDSGTSIVHIPAPMMDDAPLTAAAVFDGSLYVAVTERDRAGGPALVLHAGGSTGAGAMPLLDRRSVGAPIDQIMAIDLQFIQGAGTLDLVWAAIANVRRAPSSINNELWAGAVRFCM